MCLHQEWCCHMQLVVIYPRHDLQPVIFACSDGTQTCKRICLSLPSRMIVTKLHRVAWRNCIQGATCACSFHTACQSLPLWLTAMHMQVVREKIYKNLHQEIPYNAQVVPVSFKELADGSWRFEQNIVVPTVHVTASLLVSRVLVPITTNHDLFNPFFLQTTPLPVGIIHSFEARLVPQKTLSAYYRTKFCWCASAVFSCFCFWAWVFL